MKKVDRKKVDKVVLLISLIVLWAAIINYKAANAQATNMCGVGAKGFSQSCVVR